MALYGTYLDLSMLSTIREEYNVEFPVSCAATVGIINLLIIIFHSIFSYSNHHYHLVLCHKRATIIKPAWGRAFSRVCVSVCLFVRALTGKPLELSTPNLVHVYSIAVARHALTQQRSKGQGHTVAKTVRVARLLVAYAVVGAHVDLTAYVF